MPDVRAVMTPRLPRPELRLSVWGALAATLVAWVAYFVARFIPVVPDQGYAVALFALAPAGAVIAGVVLWARGRAEAEPELGWVAAGLAVSFVAMTLQLVSFPAVTSHAGPLRTNGNGSTLLYLLFHWSLVLGAVAGMRSLPLRWRPVAIAVGVLTAFVSAINVVPTPLLLRSDQSFTHVTLGLEYATAVVSVAVTALWVHRCGRAARALYAWVAVALAFSTYDTLLNAVAGHRYDREWWASLSMRVATYQVLAIAAVLALVIQLRRQEQYAEAELSRREAELRASLQTTGRLLASAETLTSAVRENDVARVVAEAASAATGAPRGLVEVVDDPASGRPTGALHLLASVGLDETTTAGLAAIAREQRLPGPYVLSRDEAVFTSSLQQTRALFPDLVKLPAYRDAAAVAALPLRLATGRIGALVIADNRIRDWPAHERQVLRGLADQAAQALQRAYLFDREYAITAELQRGMLPRRVHEGARVQVTARYLPGAEGMRVGGDWYDSIPLPDGRHVLVVGDVMGKGARAAAVMGRARIALYTLATQDPDPVAVLAGLDRVGDELTPDGFITLLYVLLDPATGSARVARAGHLPLLLGLPDGTSRLVDIGGSSAIGLSATARRTCADLTVPVGSTLALFTDGLVEDRTTGIDEGLSWLTAAFCDHRGFLLDELADWLLNLNAHANTYDDVCLLLARLTSP